MYAHPGQTAPDPPVQYQDPQIPFATLTRPKPGRLYTVNGVVLSDGQRFSLNFFVNGKDGDCALHCDCRFDESVVVRNSRRSGRWETEERTKGVPVPPGTPFEMMVLVERCRFMIAFNGKHHAEFVHRVPLPFIDTLTITGNVHVSLYRETNIPPDPTSMSMIPHFPVNPRFSGHNEHVYDIAGGFYNGRLLHIGGFAKGGTFCINFLAVHGSPDVSFHISCRVASGEVVFNSRQNNQWLEEIRPGNLRFRKHEHFVLEVSTHPTEYRVLLNAVSLASFPIRHIRPESVTTLQITGDVDLRYVCL